MSSSSRASASLSSNISNGPGWGSDVSTGNKWFGSSSINKSITSKNSATSSASPSPSSSSSSPSQTSMSKNLWAALRVRRLLRGGGEVRLEGDAKEGREVGPEGMSSD